MIRATAVFLLACALLFGTMGCGMVVKKEMAVSIDVNALQAGIDKAAATPPTTMTAAEASTILERNAKQFQTYANAKTVNAFEYMFDAKKSILVNGAYAQLLDNASILSTEARIRSQSGLVSVEWLRSAVVKESVLMEDVKHAKDGTRSQE